jgi:hypothetical protein
VAPLPVSTPDISVSNRSVFDIARGASDAPRRVEGRAIAGYLALAFGLAWLIEGVALARGIRFAPMTPQGTVVLASAMFTPAIAALVVRLATRERFATAGLRIGPLKFYAAVWIAVPTLVVIIYGITVALRLGTFDPSLSKLTELLRANSHGRPLPSLPPARVLVPLLFLQSVTLGVLITTVATFGEEFGWTGYLLVKLLPLGRWRAAVIYGVIWGLWHAPAIAGGFNYPGHPFTGVVMMCLLTVTFALSQTALRIRSDSVVLTSFTHACINTQGLGIVPLLFIGVSPLLGGITGFVGIAIFGVAGVWLLSRTRE